MFDGSLGKVLEFTTVYKLYKNEDEERSSKKTNSVDIVMYIRRVSRYLKEKYSRRFGSMIIGIQDSREIFGRSKERIWREEVVKAIELKKLEQERKIMEESIQEFRRVARGSKYEKRPLVKEFKRKINRIIC